MTMHEKLTVVHLDKDKGFQIACVGKVSRKLSNNAKEVITNMVEFIEKEFNQKIYSVYLNEDKYNPTRMHGINFIFKKPEKREQQDKEESPVQEAEYVDSTEWSV